MPTEHLSPVDRIGGEYLENVTKGRTKATFPFDSAAPSHSRTETTMASNGPGPAILLFVATVMGFSTPCFS